ncbi:nuclease-related domain-containing protein [Finegoldia dalianensis]|uniref:Nuclease-related domain-containing protein n=1 Tax=Finegoldia dalianensis TaxID=3145239 RepID=A0ABW9KFH2_9FIRM
MRDLYISFGIFFVLCLVLKSLWPRIKGYMGEAMVKMELSSLDKNKYSVINNLVLENSGGNTYSTQIDHLVISTYGIFSIETKNYKGLICGSEYGKRWIQNIHGNKNEFMNPSLQNYAHIQAVKSILRKYYPNIKYFSIVAFSPDAKIKVKANASIICKISQVSRKIKELSDKEILNPNDLKKVIELIEENKLNISYREHARNIATRQM